ncbi:unnamed protein product, partial [Meganyctiphanes norvegica]
MPIKMYQYSTWTWLLAFGVVIVGQRQTSSKLNQIDSILDFTSNDLYPINNDNASPGVVMENLHRGHESLLIKLHELTKALKEDELKLNNVFYKLGRHDTDLEGVTDNVKQLGKTSRKIEAKLNKHAFNVEHLRRFVEGMKDSKNEETKNQLVIAQLQNTVSRLEERLAETLARLGAVENTTDKLYKRQAPNYNGPLDHRPGELLYLQAAKPPTLTIISNRNEGLCDKAWEPVGHGCYWFGGEQLTFAEAVAACVKRNGHLLTLPPVGRDLDLVIDRLKQGGKYWTSATDAFSPDHWEFLLTAQPVLPTHWFVEPSQNPKAKQNCAAVSKDGL